MSDDSDSVSPSRIDVMDNMRLRVLYSIGRISLWYEAHHREIPVDAKTADGRDNLRRHNRLEATFIYVHCSKKGVELSGAP